MILTRSTISTPIGDMLALASDEGLCALEFVAVRGESPAWHRGRRGAPMFHPTARTVRRGVERGCLAGRMQPEFHHGLPGPGKRLSRLERRLLRWFPPHEIVDGETATIGRSREWLAAYFDGSNAAIGDLPVAMHGAPFEQRVWRALLTVPPGRTTSYGALATALGCPGASRAVGAANGANPIAIVVPCHRVIGSSGSLVGYGGGLDRKTWLLEHERRWCSDRLF